ncbi:MAG: hypothetical protein ABSC04_10075 [Syntrophobacteraceae bacterium]|jgi:hypothetical protein
MVCQARGWYVHVASAFLWPVTMHDCRLSPIRYLGRENETINCGDGGVG